jgi:SAM-dependent methyltransferase
MDERMAANRALWDEWTGVHVASDFYDVAGFKEGGVRVRPYEIEEIGDVDRKDLLHLQCHFGIDTLSWARLGANVTGADFSEAAVERARALAEELGLRAAFVCSNLYELPANLDGDFDVVYTSRGVLGWLPDLEGWAGVIEHFLRPGGTFYITEVHPFLQVFDDEEGVTQLRVRYHYFPRREPLVFPVRGSYADPDADIETPFEYGWQHSIGEIVTSLTSAGLSIDFLHEWPFLEWPSSPLEEHADGTWRLRRDQEGEIPLFFSLRATKPAP